MAWHKRGRPRRANAKRRQTTVAGRRGEADTGTEELRRRKRRVTGREDLELTGAAVLFGHDLLDRQQFDTLGLITGLLQRLAVGWGGTGGVSGLWLSITGALVRTGYTPVPGTDGGFAPAVRARRQLVRALRQLDGSRDLVIDLAEGRAPPVVLHVLERRLLRQDEAELDRLRAGLDGIAGRRQG